jgi:chemotaxis protein methyltransferase CheR
MGTMPQHNLESAGFKQRQFDSRMTDRDFSRLSIFIEKEYGIKLPFAKKTMLEGRIRKRLLALRLGSFSQYCDYLFSTQGVEDEIVHMVNVVTTNKTDFFREPNHFEFLVQSALPALIAHSGSGVGKTFMAWSAGCSTGEEPYTLAMVLAEFGEKLPGLRFDFRVVATDISTRVLEKAKRAVYGEERIEPIPMALRKKHLLRNKDRALCLIRIAPEIRTLVKFRRVNLLDQEFGFREDLDIIFCRNVLIYFDREKQEKVLGKMYRLLGPGGYLFLGHSETISGLDIPFIPVAPTIYQKGN